MYSCKEKQYYLNSINKAINIIQKLALSFLFQSLDCIA